MVSGAEVTLNLYAFKDGAFSLLSSHLSSDGDPVNPHVSMFNFASVQYSLPEGALLAIQAVPGKTSEGGVIRTDLFTLHRGVEQAGVIPTTLSGDALGVPFAFRAEITPIPEPSPVMLFALALATAWFSKRKLPV
jgi:hypothetical protein